MSNLVDERLVLARDELFKVIEEMDKIIESDMTDQVKIKQVLHVIGDRFGESVKRISYALARLEIKEKK